MANKAGTPEQISRAEWSAAAARRAYLTAEQEAQRLYKIYSDAEALVEQLKAPPEPARAKG